jgi:hypothetical protein
VYLHKCDGCTVLDVKASNAFQIKKLIAHDFQADGGEKNQFIKCVSTGKRKRTMEDRFSLHKEVGSGCVECRAIGPVNTHGTAFCIDEGCEDCYLMNSYGRITGDDEPRHVTVWKAPRSIIDECDFGRGIVGIDRGSETSVVTRTKCRLWEYHGDGELHVLKG